MYQKPQLQRFGTGRELTQAGCHAGLDILAIFGIRGDDGFHNCEPENGTS